MTHMLIRDSEMFTRLYPDAAAFVRAAALRTDCYRLAQDLKLSLADPPAHRASWLAHFAELLNAPACREPWFVVQLRGDAGEAVEQLLLGAGL